MRLTLAIFAALVSISTPIFASQRDVCRYPIPDDPAFRLVLKSVKLGDAGSFSGVFELTNREVKPKISLPVTKTEKGTALGVRYISVEFKDLNGTWRALAPLPGDFRNTKDYLDVRPGETVEFSAFLMTQDTANRSASDFRILVRLSNPDLCIVSTQFSPVPRRDAVTSFMSDHE